ncbi:MAG: hypothetical protein DLM70_14460 [Chloroflexi bacterium]|nr:MAG: hypothetical protein DLM70_14460 [Chloroflexota bacterium]
MKPGEYARRIALNMERGLSRNQARGKPSKGEPKISALKAAGLLPKHRESTERKIYSKALPALREGKSLRQAAKEAGVAPSTLKRFGRERGVIHATEHRTLKGGKSVPSRFGPSGADEWHLIASDGPKGPGGYRDVPLDSHYSSMMGRYGAAVNSMQNYGDVSRLRSLRGTVVKDTSGATYTLQTDPAAIRAYFDSLSPEDYQDFMKTFYKAKGRSHAA